MAREDGFSIVEMMVSTTVLLLVVGGALTTFKNAVAINDAASQLGDSTQNLRAGTNLLVRDLMMAGRIFGAEGVALPTCAGVLPFRHPGPPPAIITNPPIYIAFTTVSVDGTSMNLPSLTTGNQAGPVIKGSPTDIVTLMTVDQFMPVINTPAPAPAVNPLTEGTIAADGLSVLLDQNSPWLKKDTTNDTVPMKVGDLVLFKSPNGNAIQTITSTDATHIYFGSNNANDPFRFNQPCAAPNWPMATIRNGGAAVTLFRAMMITYYVDNSTTPGTPRLTRQINDFPPTALAGVVEDLDLTYDLVDGVYNPAAIPSLPWTDTTKTPALVYNSNQIRKVNVHVGVRSEQISRPTQDYVRNHITTSVDVRSMASVDRYKTTGEVQ